MSAEVPGEHGSEPRKVTADLTLQKFVSWTPPQAGAHALTWDTGNFKVRLQILRLWEHLELPYSPTLFKEAHGETCLCPRARARELWLSTPVALWQSLQCRRDSDRWHILRDLPHTFGSGLINLSFSPTGTCPLNSSLWLRALGASEAPRHLSVNTAALWNDSPFFYYSSSALYLWT